MTTSLNGIQKCPLSTRCLLRHYSQDILRIRTLWTHRETKNDCSVQQSLSVASSTTSSGSPLSEQNCSDKKGAGSSSFPPLKCRHFDMEIGSYKNPLEFTLARIETICAMWNEMALPPETARTNGANPHLVGRVRDGLKVERVERKRSRRRRRREGEHLSLSCPSPVSIPAFHCLSVLLQEKEWSWAETQDFSGSPSRTPVKHPSGPLAGEQRWPFSPQKSLRSTSAPLFSFLTL